MGRYIERSLSYRISSYLAAEQKQKALKIVEKASINERWLRRIITEFDSDWRTFRNEDDAIWCFNEILKTSKNEQIIQTAYNELIVCRNKKAILLIYKAEFEAAQKILVESIEKKLDDGHTHLFYSLVLRKQGSITESDEQLQKYLDFRPEYDYDDYALFLHKIGMDNEAQFFFKKALDNPKNALNTYQSYLEYLKETKKFSDILEYCQKIDSIIPNDSGTFHDRAFAFIGLGRYTEAIDQLWGCIKNADALDKDVSVQYMDSMRLITAEGRENYKRVVAREICDIVTFGMNSKSPEEIEKVKKFFPKDYNWTMFYNGCIWYVQARNHWYNRDWEKANEAFWRAETRFDMSDELAAMGHALIIWRLFSTDKKLNELFSEIDLLDRQDILEKIDKLSKSIERTPRTDGFGQIINGYVDSLEYLNKQLDFFRDNKTVKQDKTIFARIRVAFANNDFAAGFDTLDAIRKIEACIARYLSLQLPNSKKKKKQFYDKCWMEIKEYLNTAIVTMNGPSMYQMVRSGDQQIYLSNRNTRTNSSLEPSVIFGSETEKELIAKWREFRDIENVNKKAEREYQSLVRLTTGLWSECNEVAKQKNWKARGYVFKPTNKIFGIPLTLNDTVVRNRDGFAHYIKLIHIWIIEASSNSDRLPTNEEIEHYADIIKNLRNHFEHDREHGKEADVRKKYMLVGGVFEELIGKQPFKEIDWWLLQLGVLLRVKAILSLVLDNLTSNKSSNIPSGA